MCSSVCVRMRMYSIVQQAGMVARLTAQGSERRWVFLISKTGEGTQGISAKIYSWNRLRGEYDARLTIGIGRLSVSDYLLDTVCVIRALI